MRKSFEGLPTLNLTVLRSSQPVATWRLNWWRRWPTKL